jgi:hypothetical protein
LPSESVTDLRDAIRTQLAPFTATIAGQVGSVGTYHTVSEAVETLALAYMQEGDSFDRAASRAAEDVIGKKYTFKGRVRVPAELDADAIMLNAGRVLEAIEGGIVIPPSLAKVDLPGRTEAYLSALKAQGSWVTSPGETGLTLYDGLDYIVRREDGTPFELTWDEIVEQGEALWSASERQQIEQMQGLDAAMPGLGGGGRRDPLDYPELRQ